MLAVVMIFSLIPNVYALTDSGQESLPFSDIKGHWAEKTIIEHAQKGFLQGYPDGTFRPDQGMRRCELVALINRYFGLIQQGSDNFEDVKGMEWYAPDTARARYYGYLEGLRARPEELATREDVVEMVSLLLDLAEQERVKEGIDFSDIENLDEGIKENILTFSQMGYLQGYPDGMFKPDRIINRAEIMTIAENVLGYIVTNQEDWENIPEGVKKITVIKPDIVIKDKDITADLYITPGVAGNITIQDSTIKGKLEIGGGSSDKPIILENVTADKVIITKAKEEPKLVIKSSDIEELKVKVTTNIDTDSKTTITEAKINAGAQIGGEGKIKKAYIDSNNVKLEKKPEYIEIISKDIAADVNEREINQSNDDKYPRRSSSHRQTPQLIPVTSVEITGTATVGETVYAVVTPADATVTYQWQRSGDGTEYEDISGAAQSSYVLTGEDEGKQIWVVAEGTGDYTGTVASEAIGPITVDPVTAKIREGWIPVANKQELKQIEIASENTFGAGTKWEGTYTGGMDKKYMLVADIDLAGDNFVPIGYDEAADTASGFTGALSGEGYVIKNLTIDRDRELQGLFSRLGSGALVISPVSAPWRERRKVP